MYDLIIIGGGPGGTAAAVYAARKLLKTVLITENFGGQSSVSADIENWIGTPHISGADLAKSFETHARTHEGEYLSIALGARAVELAKATEGFTVTLSNGQTYTARTVLITSGGTRRQLTAPGAAEFEHKGLTYCASCDGPLFAGQDVAVIGGGNAGFESAAQLLAYCKSVTLLQSRDHYVADEATVAKVLAHPNMHGVTGTTITSVFGDKFVKGLTYKTSDGTETTLNVSGIFVEIGLAPSTDYVANIVELDSVKRVIVDPLTQRTKTLGIWAAGDCTNGKYHQNNIAAGDAVKALEDIYLYLKAK